MHLVNNLYPVRALLRNPTGYAPAPLAHVGQGPRTKHLNQGEDSITRCIGRVPRIATAGSALRISVWPAATGPRRLRDHPLSIPKVDRSQTSVHPQHQSTKEPHHD